MALILALKYNRVRKKRVSSNQTGFSLNSKQGIFAVLNWSLVVLAQNGQREYSALYDHQRSVSYIHIFGPVYACYLAYYILPIYFFNLV